MLVYNNPRRVFKIQKGKHKFYKFKICIKEISQADNATTIFA